MKTKGSMVLVAGLLILSAIGVLKSLILGLEIDEEYAVALAYRFAGGDRLLKEMWEPHQLSAVFPAIFVKLFTSITGGVDYLVLYLRIIGVLLQLGISVFWYWTMKKHFGKMVSFLTALMFFHTLPKWIQTPEFANMQIWFFVLTFLCLLRYYQENKIRYCILGGVFMVLEVLAYPSCVLVFAVYVFLFLKKKDVQGKRDIRGLVVFCGICMGAAVMMTVYLLSDMSVGELLTSVEYVLLDGSHSAGILEKTQNYLKETCTILRYLLPHGVFAAVCTILYIYIYGRENSCAGICMWYYFDYYNLY